MSKLEEFKELAQKGKNGRFSLYDTHLSPGETASLGLPLPELLGYAPLYLPVKVINGKQSGPTTLMFATMRGDEFNGMEILKQISEMSLMDDLHGTLILVPVLNVFGLLNRRPYLPDGEVLDRAFPGAETGTYSQRMAHLFIDSLFDRCDVCVEICSGSLNHNLLPHLYTNCAVAENRQLAGSFPVSVVVNIEPEEGSLHKVAVDSGKLMLTYSAGEAMRFDADAIRFGKKGLLRLLRQVGMLPESGKSAVEKKHEPVFTESSDWLYATKSGISHPKVKLGDRVRKGQTVAVISEPLGSFQEVTVSALHEGVIVGSNDLPLVFEGDPLFRVAKFDEPGAAADKLQEWTEGGLSLPSEEGEAGA